MTEPPPYEAASSPVTTYRYDVQDNLSKVTDANDHESLYEYDDFGNLLSETSPDTGKTTYFYDLAGNLISRTDANGITVTYTYDALNRLTGVHFPDPSEDIIYTYDQGTFGKGRLTGITDPSGSYTFTYDGFGNLVREDKVIDGQRYSVEYGYDPSGHITSIIYPDGLKVNYDLDLAGRVVQVNVIRNDISTIVASNIEYLPFGPLRALTYGNGVQLVKAYDLDYRITSIGSGSILDLSYTLDAVGHVTAITDNIDSDMSQVFSYDSLYRLTHAQGGYGTINYTYDLVGNRLSKTVNSSETDTYSYFPGTNRLHEITGAHPARFCYDANGNVIAQGEKRLIYNQNNRLIQVSEGDRILGQYTYNAFGQRVKKEADGVVTIYHYDLSGNLLSEQSSTGEIIDYIYIGNVKIAALVSVFCPADIDDDGDVDGMDLYLLIQDFGRSDCSEGSPCIGDLNADHSVDTADLSILAASFGRTDCLKAGFYYYHNDHLGMPLKMTDSSGNVVWKGNYLPFGKVNMSTGNVTNPFRCPGQYEDSETGLYYNWHRYYQPEIGRYLRPDPIRLEGGINLYAYVQNDPVNLIDMEGLKEAGYGAWEGQFILGYGEVTIICCDGNNLIKHKYRKVCYGIGFIVGVSSGAAFGGQNQCCKNPPQKLIAPEFGFGIVSSLGIECGIGFSKEGANPYLGGSGGLGFKATVCIYWLVDSKKIGCCSK